MARWLSAKWHRRPHHRRLSSPVTTTAEAVYRASACDHSMQKYCPSNGIAEELDYNVQDQDEDGEDGCTRISMATTDAVTPVDPACSSSSSPQPASSSSSANNNSNTNNHNGTPDFAAGTVLGLHNLYVVAPQFLASALCSPVFYCQSAHDENHDGSSGGSDGSGIAAVWLMGGLGALVSACIIGRSLL